MNSSSKRRITMKLKHPNPLFERWLTEWRDKAIETDSKMQHCFSKALQSLGKYPIPLESGRDCRILQGFGEKLCHMLDEKLTKHKRNNSTANCTTNNNDMISEDRQGNHGKKRRSTNKNNVPINQGSAVAVKRKEYIPLWGSGPYAILITLYKKSLEQHYSGYMLKRDIIRNGQQFCDKSFVKAEPGSYYTAWSSMKTLLEKNLVTKSKSPAQFSLTDEGLILAHKLYTNNLNDDISTNTNNVIDGEGQKPKSKVCSETSSARLKSKDARMNKTEANSQNTLSCVSVPSEQFVPPEIESQTETEYTYSSNMSQEETFIFTPHSFDIVLLVDKQETAGATQNPLDDSTLAELTNLKVMYEVRHLKVGDYTWICRQRLTNKELVLPYIVERKRMDDFGFSIKDGRFHEQKFRLKQCGIEKVVYLIESYGSNTHTGLPVTTLYQAATNTLLQDNFSVKFTDNLRGTIEYLASLTSILKNVYENKTIVSCPKENLLPSVFEDDLVSVMTFQEFNKGASKNRNFKVRELFVRQLLQLKGMSVEKALAVAEQYPTPQLLKMTYNVNAGAGGEKLLATVQHGKLGKKIGPVISKAIFELYTRKTF